MWWLCGTDFVKLPRTLIWPWYDKKIVSEQQLHFGVRCTVRNRMSLITTQKHIVIEPVTNYRRVQTVWNLIATCLHASKILKSMDFGEIHGTTWHALSENVSYCSSMCYPSETTFVVSLDVLRSAEVYFWGLSPQNGPPLRVCHVSMENGQMYRWRCFKVACTVWNRVILFRTQECIHTTLTINYMTCQWGWLIILWCFASVKTTNKRWISLKHSRKRYMCCLESSQNV